LRIAVRSFTRYTTLFEQGAGLALDCGRTLGPLTVAWEQYGEPNRDRTNVVLVCHALSGGAHAAGRHDGASKPGWWDEFIGPGRAFDTSHFCVICSNVLGSCYGTTGPASDDPATGRPFGPDFPVVTVWDMVRVQKALLDRLGIPELAGVAGGSMGGMQALAWSVLYPDFVRAVVAIATTDRHSPMQIAFNEVARRAVMGDPAWQGGRYEAGRGPQAGLAVARMIGHITYLSDARMERKFGRRGAPAHAFALDATEFEIERYLAHQGESFVRRFDANALLFLSKALDYFDLAEQHGSLEVAAQAARARFLLLTFTSDWLYPAAQLERLERVLTAAGRRVEYRCLTSTEGHDAFLLEHERQAPIIRGFLLDGERSLHAHREVAGERADEQVVAAPRGSLEGDLGRLAGTDQPGEREQLPLDRRGDELGVPR